MSFLLVKKIVKDASASGDLPFADPNSLSGSSLRQLLKSLSISLVTQESAYTEIGVFRGGTLLDVASVTSGRCIGIDNFSLFDSQGVNEKHIRRRILEEGYKNVELVSLDFEVASHNFDALFPGLSVSLLMVDGAHDYRSQLLALLGMERNLSANAVIVVDDANYSHVRQAGYDFVMVNQGWEIACEILTRSHPDRGGKSRWWNGVQILTRTESNQSNFDGTSDSFLRDSVEASEPQETVDSLRETHELFRHQLSPVMLEILDQVRDFPLDDLLLSNLKALVSSDKVSSRYPSQNVDVTPHQIGVRFRPTGHEKRLQLPPTTRVKNPGP